MVSFYCMSCDATLKKPQIVKHMQGRCFPSFSCLQCKKIFDGQTIHAHTECISEQEQWHGQYYKPKQSKDQKQQQQTIKQPVKENAWIGWKKTIRKVIKENPDRQMKLKKCRKIVIDQYIKQHSDQNKDEIKKIFDQKVQKFEIKDKIVFV